MKALSLSSPAGMTTAPAGGDAGPPPRMAELPQTRTGGDVGPPVKAGPPRAVPPAAEDAPAAGDAEPVSGECPRASPSQVRPASTTTPAVTQATSPQPEGSQRGRPWASCRCRERIRSGHPSLGFRPAGRLAVLALTQQQPQIGLLPRGRGHDQGRGQVEVEEIRRHVGEPDLGVRRHQAVCHEEEG